MLNYVLLYVFQYSPEEIEWYGLTFAQACQKFIRKKEIEAGKPKPLKCVYRSELIDKLRQVGISGEVKDADGKVPVDIPR